MLCGSSVRVLYSLVFPMHACQIVYINSLHAEMIYTSPFINAEINVISLRSKWQALPSKPWAVPVG